MKLKNKNESEVKIYIIYEDKKGKKNYITL